MTEDQTGQERERRLPPAGEEKRQFIEALTEAVQGRDPATPFAERLGHALERPVIYPRTVAESMAAPAWRRIDFREFREQVPLPLRSPYALGSWMSAPAKRALTAPATAKAISKLGSPRYGTRFWTAAELIRRRSSDEIDLALLQVVDHDPEERVRGIAALALAAHRFPGVRPLAQLAATATELCADDEAVLMAVFAAALAWSWDRRPEDVEPVMAVLGRAEERASIAEIVRQIRRQLLALPTAGEPVVLVREMLDPV